MPVEVVLDASVAAKWVLRDARNEADVPAANQILSRVRDGEVRLYQPPHFVLEMSAVLARESPANAARDLGLIQQIEMAVVAEPDIVRHALALAVRHRQHVFDTMYHAVALARPRSVLVTADERYWRAAHREGAIVRLADFARFH
jgi:predicted nucleic acid-binding protein